MSHAYYCLVAGLPDIALDDAKVPLATAALRADLTEQLVPADRPLLSSLFYPVDNDNFLAVLEESGREHDARGNFSRETLVEEIRVPSLIPGYMREFLDMYRAGLPAGSHPRNVLAGLFYRDMASSSCSFVRGWYAFDRDLRNIVAALGCRRTGRDPVPEVVGEGLVAEAARRSTAADFGLTRECVWLDGLLRAWPGNLLERELALDRIRLDVIAELTLWSGFSVDTVLAFVVRLGIVERWLALDAATGRALLSRILDDMKSGLVFPEEYSIHGGSKHGDNR